mgnify:CR=1 FL=1
MKMLAIGSVFKYEGIKLMVVGHDVDKKTNEYSYIALPYPVGFAGKDRMYAVKANEEVEVLYEGYLTARGEKYMGQLDKISDLTPAQVVVYNTIATEALKRANGGQQ